MTDLKVIKFNKYDSIEQQKLLDGMILTKEIIPSNNCCTSKYAKRLKRFTFTLNNPKYAIKAVDCIRYICFQIEKGDNGTIHYQGYIELKKQLRYNNINKIIFNGQNPHIEVATKCQLANIRYCTKLKGRVHGPWEYGFKAQQGFRTDIYGVMLEDMKNKDVKIADIAIKYPDLYVKYSNGIEKLYQRVRELQQKEEIYDIVEEKGYNKWQKEIIESLEKQNDRQVTWVFDKKGGSGKTELARHLILNNDACYFTNSKTKDIAYAYNGEKTVIFDLARSLEDRVNYQSIEQIKNGLMFSSKYTSVTKIFNKPKVLIMANFMPEMSKLSMDRWDILDLHDELQKDWINESNDIFTQDYIEINENGDRNDMIDIFSIKKIKVKSMESSDLLKN